MVEHFEKYYHFFLGGLSVLERDREKIIEIKARALEVSTFPSQSLNRP
jgi:hypothetical protein